MISENFWDVYGSFSIEEARDVGKQFKAICIGPRGMEGRLTMGNEYTITITPRILPLSPLCSFMGDNGRVCEAHLHRFEKKGKIDETETR